MASVCRRARARTCAIVRESSRALTAKWPTIVSARRAPTVAPVSRRATDFTGSSSLFLFLKMLVVVVYRFFIPVLVLLACVHQVSSDSAATRARRFARPIRAPIRARAWSTRTARAFDAIVRLRPRANSVTSVWIRAVRPRASTVSAGACLARVNATALPDSMATDATWT